jgi:Fe-S cluster biogenesis protein NfuA
VDVPQNRKNLEMENQELTSIVEKALEEIRPFLISDGGNISLVSIEEDIVKVKLEGACVGCSINQMTLRNGVEASIKKHAPQIKKVIDISSVM